MFFNLRESAYLDPLHSWLFDEFFDVFCCCFFAQLLEQRLENKWNF